MITINDFTQEMYNDIIAAAKRSLVMFGINADVNVTRDGKNKNVLMLNSSEFNTIPVVFQSIHINGWAELEDVEGNDKVKDLVFPLSYRFEYFNGGYNGAYLGTLKFRVFVDNPQIRFVGFTIR